jgi:serine/threonine protein phosphatase PrpC
MMFGKGGYTMNEKMYKSKWHIIGQSVRGAQHERLGLPNQDAIKWIPESGGDSPLILAVSDGHGSIESFRSDIGSELAVNCAIKVIRSFLKNLPNADTLFSSSYLVEEKLPQKIVQSWRSAVADNLATTPFRISELDKLEVEKGPAARRHVTLEPIITYGSTLISVIISESYIIYLQLGDGDIITVSETGEVARPLPVDNRLFAN